MNDLRTLIDLCPGTRLQQYEPEIFSNPKLTDYYLRKLCEQYGYYHGDSVPGLAYHYAKYVMKSRWLEAEPVIAANRDHRKWYNNAFGINLTPPRNKIMARLATLLCMN